MLRPDKDGLTTIDLESFFETIEDFGFNLNTFSFDEKMTEQVSNNGKFLIGYWGGTENGEREYPEYYIKNLEEHEVAYFYMTEDNKLLMYWKCEAETINGWWHNYI